MADIVIVPATADRFDDAEHALSGGGDGHSCQCQWWTITNAQFRDSSRDELQDLLHDELHSAAPPPALIAYVDGEAAGWVRVGPRPSQVRIARTREIAANTPTDLEDPDVWAVSCFVVRREHRGEGLTPRLLDAAVEYATAHGARIIEAYPYDTATTKKSVNQLFRGVLSVFEAAGFRVVARPKPDRAIVALEVSG